MIGVRVSPPEAGFFGPLPLVGLAIGPALQVGRLVHGVAREVKGRRARCESVQPQLASCRPGSCWCCMGRSVLRLARGRPPRGPGPVSALPARRADSGRPTARPLLACAGMSAAHTAWHGVAAGRAGGAAAGRPRLGRSRSCTRPGRLVRAALGAPPRRAPAAEARACEAPRGRSRATVRACKRAPAAAPRPRPCQAAHRPRRNAAAGRGRWRPPARARLGCRAAAASARLAADLDAAERPPRGRERRG